MDDIPADAQGVVAPYGPGGGVCWISGANELAGVSHSVFSLDHHGHHGAAGDELDQALVEGLPLVDLVVLLRLLRGDLEHLEAYDLEARPLDP